MKYDVIHAHNFIAESDIVINTSLSEGMANILLEAQQLGKPILARDVAGNRAIVTPGVDGFLFKDSQEFEHYARKLVEDPNLRDQIGRAGMEHAKKYDLEEEISMYTKVYQV